MAGGFTLLFDSPFMRLEHDEARALVRFVRLSKGFDDLGYMARVYGDMTLAAASLDRQRLSLLMDIREAPARNDPAFEEAIKRHRARITEGYRRVSMLVKTSVGKLQVVRHTREDGLNSLVTQSEDEALKYLLG